MRRRPEVLAWVVSLASFGLFCAMVVGILLGVFWYRREATIPRPARLTIIGGTILVRGRDQINWVSGTDDMELKEGDAIKTDETSQALVTLLDHSVVILYSGAEVELDRMACSRFEPEREWIAISHKRGKAHIGVAVPGASEKHFEVRTPQAVISLAEGSYTVAVDDRSTTLRVKERGEAKVSAQNLTVGLREGQRTEVQRGGVPSAPEIAKEDLVFNGDFSQGLMAWQKGNLLGFQEGFDVLGEVITALEDGRPVVHFSRRESKGTHCETYIYQEIDKDVSDLSTLKLALEFKLLYQSLSGGGYMGSEYPLFVYLRYRAQDGEAAKVYGFYYQNESNNRTDNGVMVVHNQWQEWTAPDNLMALTPRPVQILSLQVSASGWDYQSMVSQVSLVGE